MLTDDELQSRVVERLQQADPAEGWATAEDVLSKLEVSETTCGHGIRQNGTQAGGRRNGDLRRLRVGDAVRGGCALWKQASHCGCCCSRSIATSCLGAVLRGTHQQADVLSPGVLANACAHAHVPHRKTQSTPKSSAMASSRRISWRNWSLQSSSATPSC
jgi:hypothetical protein